MKGVSLKGWWFAAVLLLPNHYF